MYTCFYLFIVKGIARTRCATTINTAPLFGHQSLTGSNFAHLVRGPPAANVDQHADHLKSARSIPVVRQPMTDPAEVPVTAYVSSDLPRPEVAFSFRAEHLERLTARWRVYCQDVDIGLYKH